VNRIGEEDGVKFNGHSSVTDELGKFIVFLEHDRPQLVFATLVDKPQLPYMYLSDRRPELYPKL